MVYVKYWHLANDFAPPILIEMFCQADICFAKADLNSNPSREVNPESDRPTGCVAGIRVNHEH
jgi:hypothetical protein